MQKLNNEAAPVAKEEDFSSHDANLEAENEANNEIDEGVEVDKGPSSEIEADPKTPLTEDSCKVKFLPTGGNSSINGGAKMSVDTVVTCLTKDELMQFARDPFWVKIRWILFIFFWLIWLVMLVLAVVIVVLAPKCPAPPDREWWQASPIYEVYVRSFKDSDGDGNGDLKGIESKLDYLHDDLGVQTLWLSPVYKSPMIDSGYDVEDFEAIADIFGTMEDFDSLIDAMKKKGVKLIMDFVPNHTSRQHPWFIKSEEGDEKYKDYYVWTDGRNNKPMYNWLSVYNGSAWDYSKKRKQYYLHQFMKDQPDLNLRNPEVVDELKRILRFWLDKGVHGFRMSSVAHLYEDLSVEKEERSGIEGVNANEYEYLNHEATLHQPENLQLLREFRELLDEYKAKDDVTRVMILEAGKDMISALDYYGNGSEPIAHFPLNYGFIDLDESEPLNGHNLQEAIITWINNTEDYKEWPNWMLGNHDVPRVATRHGTDFVDILNVITILLPGTPITYYGEELGMVNGNIYGAQVDSSGRDPERTPMQWDEYAFAGFSNGSDSWLPVNDDYNTINVEAQKENHNSHLNFYKELVKLKKKKAAQFGDIKFPVVTDTIFSFTRTTLGAPGICIVANLGNVTETIDLSGADKMPDTVIKELPIPENGHRVQLYSNDVKVAGKKAIVISFVPQSG